MPMTDSLFAMLHEGTENRVAFIAALIMQRCKVDSEASPLIKVPAYAPHHAERIATTLCTLAYRIKRHAEAECSREVTDAEARRDEANQVTFHAIAKEIGMEASTGGDPRGPCAYLIDPKHPGDGDGWGKGWACWS